MNEKIENLKYIIDRYDHYIESSQTKSNVYLSLNTAIFGGIITLLSALKMNELNTFLILILVIIALLSILSICFTLLSVKPNFSDKGFKSIIYFNDVSKLSKKEYFEKVKNISEEKMFLDFSNQAQDLSSILSKKYNSLKWVGTLIKVEFILFLIWLIILIFK